MGRIVGVWSRELPARGAAAAALRRAIRSREQQLTETELDSCWAATVGPRPASIHETPSLLAIVDGPVFNLPAPQSRAALFVAARYKEVGFERAISELNGDCVVIVADARTSELWIARDRVGIRPLYYVASGGVFAFASQPGALLDVPGVSFEVNRRYAGLVAASHYRYFDNAPSESPYRDVAQLPAGHLLHVTVDAIDCAPYWRLAATPDFTATDAELAEQYRDVLLDAVGCRLAVSERPAFTLSGGMDSSSVIACAVHLAGAKQNALSVVYDDRTFDESDDIRMALDALVEEWHPCPVGEPDVFGLLERMIAVHDEPVATATWLSHFLLCEDAASRGFGTLFGGLGGDELNAGEYEHFLYHFADLRRAGDEPALSHEVQMWIRYHDHPIYRKTPAVAEANLRRHVDLSSPGKCVPDRDRLTRYAAALNADFFDLAAYEPVIDQPFDSYLKNRTFHDLTRETTPCCLRAEDRHAAKFGIDHFLPFLDYRVIEFMFRVPGRLKIRDGVTKRLLRDAMAGILPEVVRTRIKKTGWNAPAHVWFSGAGRERLMDLVRSRAFRERGIYDVGEVCRLIDEHDAIVTNGQVRENHMMFLWQLVNLELWLQAIDRRVSAAVSATSH